MNRYVIADAAICIGCKTCEIACAVSHHDGNLSSMQSKDFVARLEVLRIGMLTTPVMCRQCDNAPCANVCPTGAIIRKDNTIQVIQERCIGCKSCAVICPFGAMTVKTVQQQSDMQAKAIKCDLCIDNPLGPACVRACPTKAIRLVEPDAINQQVDSRQEQAAARQMSAFL